MPDFQMDTVIVGLDFFSYPVVAVFASEVDNLLQLHVTGGFPLYFLVAHHDFIVENLLFYPFIEIVCPAYMDIPCMRLDILLAGIRLSIGVLIEVDFFAD